VGTLHKDDLFFFFLGAPCIFSDKTFSDKCGGRLSAKLFKREEIFLGRSPFWSGALGLQASLVGEGQDGVLLQKYIVLGD
jgi:hypothetical protein